MKTYLLDIQKELNSIDKILDSIEMDSIEIKQELRQFLIGKSKRIRTVITSLYIKNAKNIVSDVSLKIMAAGELIHNASLLQDDVIDDESLRRGLPTLNSIYNNSIATLAGDYLIAIATEILLNIGNLEILNIFLDCLKKMCKAEFTQYFARGKILSINEYLEVCEGKTAYLFIAIIQSCAIVEKLPIDDAIKYAKDFGIYFQLKNDITLESVNADIKNKIYTARNILGVEKSNILIDNYEQRVLANISALNNNTYKKDLGDLVREL